MEDLLDRIYAEPDNYELRQIYADAPGQGAVVWDMKARSQAAADELDLLFAEILPESLTTSTEKETTP